MQLIKTFNPALPISFVIRQSKGLEEGCESTLHAKCVSWYSVRIAYLLLLLQRKDETPYIEDLKSVLCKSALLLSFVIRGVKG